MNFNSSHTVQCVFIKKEIQLQIRLDNNGCVALLFAVVHMEFRYDRTNLWQFWIQSTQAASVLP